MRSGFEGVKHRATCVEETFREVAGVGWRAGVFPCLPPFPSLRGHRLVSQQGCGDRSMSPGAAGQPARTGAVGQQEQQTLFSAEFPGFFSD